MLTERLSLPPDNFGLYLDFDCELNSEHLKDVVEFITEALCVNAFLVLIHVDLINLLHLLDEFHGQAALVAVENNRILLVKCTFSELLE